ncbi:MAG: hypothetical protein H6658_03080 [Ardenticatenaceae bacterium]|nr:hypothetical protein [Ardenticatenaceae bacterium]
MKRPIPILLFVMLLLILVTIQVVLAREEGDGAIYLPFIVSPALDCNVPGASYDTLTVLPPPTDRPAEEHGDLNLALRNYEPTTADLSLQDVNGGTDPNAPQLDGLFADHRVPVFSAAYQVHHWDWGCNCQADVITDPEVTHLGMAVDPGEIIYVPDSGYNIGNGKDVLVLYASEERLTLKYTGEDNVVWGYTVHIENICVEPDLLALYRFWNEAGRADLPALAGGEALGRAKGAEISVSIRDTGAFMDPRTRKDWWQDH